MRTGSLQLSSTSAGSSSLKRTKRKAPSPPSKTVLLESDDSSHVTGNVNFSINITFVLCFLCALHLCYVMNHAFLLNNNST